VSFSSNRLSLVWAGHSYTAPTPCVACHRSTVLRFHYKVGVLLVCSKHISGINTRVGNLTKITYGIFSRKVAYTSGIKPSLFAYPQMWFIFNFVPQKLLVYNSVYTQPLIYIWNKLRRNNSVLLQCFRVLPKYLCLTLGVRVPQVEDHWLNISQRYRPPRPVTETALLILYLKYLEFLSIIFPCTLKFIYPPPPTIVWRHTPGIPPLTAPKSRASNVTRKPTKIPSIFEPWSQIWARHVRRFGIPGPLPSEASIQHGSRILCWVARVFTSVGLDAWAEVQALPVLEGSHYALLLVRSTGGAQKPW
jgi:hypothetical protein